MKTRCTGCGKTLLVRDADIAEGNNVTECKCGLAVSVEVETLIHCPRQGDYEEPDSQCDKCGRPLCLGVPEWTSDWCVACANFRQVSYAKSEKSTEKNYVINQLSLCRACAKKQTTTSP